MGKVKKFNKRPKKLTFRSNVSRGYRKFARIFLSLFLVSVLGILLAPVLPVLM